MIRARLRNLNFYILVSLVSLLLICEVIFTPDMFAVDVKEGKDVRPQYEIDQAASQTMAMVGVGVAAEFLPVVAGVKSAYTVTNIFAEIGKDSIGHANKISEAKLVVISADAEKLVQLHNSGVSLKNNNQAIDLANRLARNLSDVNNKFYSYAASAIVSPYGLYATVKAVGVNKLASHLGKEGTQWIGVGDKTKLAWLGEGRLAKGLTRTEWGHLKKVANLTKQLSDSLTKVVLKMLAKKIANESIDTFFDSAVEDVLRKEASQQGGSGSRYSGPGLRLGIVSLPDLTLSGIQEIQIPFGDSADIQSLQIPEAITTFNDPVINSVLIEKQVVKEQHYDVQPSQSTVHPYYGPVNYPPPLDFHFDPTPYFNNIHWN